MKTTTRRASAVAFALTLLATCFAGAKPAGADPVLPIQWEVNVTATMAALGQTMEMPPGTFDGEIDLGTGELRGDLSLPPVTVPLKLGGLRLATAVIEMQSAAPLTGSVDLVSGTVTTTASFNIHLKSVRIFGINVVGNRCRTASPVTNTFSGPINLAGASTFEGEFSIPKFRDCGFLITPIINLAIPGGGNTMSASFAPPA